MTVYDLKNKDLKKEFRKFGKTTLGKVVFCLAYSIPLIAFIASAEMFAFSQLFPNYKWFYGPALIIALSVTFVSFILGSRYFYKEFRVFFDTTHKDENK